MFKPTNIPYARGLVILTFDSFAWKTMYKETGMQ